MARKLSSLIGPLIAAVMALIVHSLTVGRTAGAWENRLQTVERRADKAESLINDLQGMIMPRLETIQDCLTELAAEQRILHGRPPRNRRND